MNLEEIERNDPTFPEDVKESHWAVDLSCRWMNTQPEFTVTPFRLRVRPDIERMREFSDGGDSLLIVRDRGMETSHIVETKHLKEYDFDSLKTFLFPDILVDNSHKFTPGRRNPTFYVHLNREAIGAVIIAGRTFARWEKREFFDRKKGRPRKAYFCPIELCCYKSLIYPPGRLDVWAARAN